ncbi:S-adenosyl-L-methionine-dependent methyltransferase [Dacryopinax primogenitus]|uniref:S-adenosyl-L-methionine-dependent methyltransferase n=1 Tax=Dacryopinax primogenitus (strain DJM 731) TaxID=1858805 RepID=M5G5L9_DACPD|nr:S-adenosyl-L-methionine-dependent methyltransferase [Dacryopinax primogenitus]EJU03999.1 S-adenosyl-L-methionine-dependent methyltransferase [Dacryopinax primogenitus]
MNPTYSVPQTGIDERSERRLNAQHYGIKDFFGVNNCGAPWPTHPKPILEIGSGNGVWAREVCEQLPEAEVVGVDIVDGLRSKPPNFTFRLLNLVKDPWPFSPGSFDIVHCRYVTMHIPNCKQLLDNAIEATAPGGILMFEDQDQQLRAEGKPVSYPAVLAFTIFRGYCESCGVNPRPGALLAPMIIASGQFSETHETIVPAPMGPWTEDKKLHVIGEGMRTGIIEAARAFSPKVYEFGMTKSIVEGMVRELENPENKIYANEYLVWARKKPDHL